MLFTRSIRYSMQYTSWVVSNFFLTPTLGNDPIWRIFFNGWFSHQLDIACFGASILVIGEAAASWEDYAESRLRVVVL